MGDGRGGGGGRARGGGFLGIRCRLWSVRSSVCVQLVSQQHFPVLSLVAFLTQGGKVTSYH